MISDKDKIQMFAMKVDGHSLEEIGKEYGITRERVHQVLSSIISHRPAVKRGVDRIIYPNIAKWMRENDVTISDLVVKLGYKFSYAAVAKLSSQLNGSAKLGFRMDEIRKILDVTGMKFEEAFIEKGR